MSSDLMRLAGINSGYDTEAMIEKMMSSYQAKIDTQNKKLQKLTWQQEAYRDITSKMTEFKNKYFDILKRDTYLMSPSSFNKYKTNITTKSGKVSGLKVTTSSDAKPGSHTLRVVSLATAALTKGGQVATSNFKLDVDKAMKDAKADDSGNYNFALDVKVGNVARTVEFSGKDKDELLASLNSELEDAFGKTSSGKAFISASVKDGNFAFETSGNAMATVTERTGNFGMGKPATKVAIDMGQALTGQSSVSVTVPNFYTGKEVTKNVKFQTVSSTYFNSYSSDENIKAAFLNLKKSAYSEEYGVAYAQVTEKMMDENKFSYTPADAARDLNMQSMLNALNSAYGMEQGISFSVSGSSVVAKYMHNGSSAEFTMTSTCDSTFGLRKGSATSYIDETMKLSDLGIEQNKKGDPTTHALPAGFNLDLDRAVTRATADGDGNYNFAVDVNVDGVSRTINFKGNDTDSLMDSLNKGLADAFGAGKLVASKGDNNDLKFEFLGSGSVTVKENTGDFGLYNLENKVTFNPGDVTGPSEQLIIRMNDKDGKPYDTTINMLGLHTPADFSDPTDQSFIDLKEAAYRKANGMADGDPITDTADLDAFAYTAVDAARDENAAGVLTLINDAMQSDGLTFAYENGKLSAKNADGKDVSFAVDSVVGGANFGKANGLASTAVTDGSDTADGYSLTINGKTIDVDKNATVSDLMNAVNKSGAGVTMTYSKIEGTFKITANDMGAGADIRIDGNNALAQALKLTDDTMTSHTDGTNAMISIDGIEIEHNGNTYELDGITFDFADVDPAEGDTITVNVDKSYDDIKAAIKGFVDDYNKMIDDIYNYIDTAPKRDSKNNLYEPLTDAEKEEMSEDEIKKMEEAAKVGILYNDNTVYSALSSLRSALTTSITLEDGTRFSLASMGIKTVSLLNGDPNDMRRGKLQLDEDRLDKVLRERPDDVVELFTSKQGAMGKASEALDRAVKNSSFRKQQGTLVRKAGLATGTSAKDNAIYKEMERINKRIETLKERYEKKEDYWWSVFTNLEKMMANMNSQMNYMASYLSSNTNTSAQ